MTDTSTTEAAPETQRVQELDSINPAPETSGEAPRPALTLRQAAAVLGKSMRALERSLLGRWGNKLPEGWTAQRIETDSGAEWRIIPPAGFLLRQPKPAPGPLETLVDVSDELLSRLFQDKRQPAAPPPRYALDQPAIVIDRGDEVEQLLRELLQAQRQLAEERRLRLEDLRLITQMQGSLRLLEDRAAQTNQLKEALQAARQETGQLKQQYLELLQQPWWKRIFK